MADWMTVPLLYYEGTGKAPQRVGLAHPTICPYGAFATADGALVLISIQNEREWREFCTVFLQNPRLATEPGFETNIIRVQNRAAVDARVASVFHGLSREEAAARLRAANTAYGFVNDVPALSRHPALRRLPVGTANGPVQLVAPPVQNGASRTLGPVPAIGEHSAAIRREFAA
jgi:crotonobetainyl-CoA:carnitine CoA-transferase CaiB-like acyl-CoA transferase